MEVVLYELSGIVAFVLAWSGMLAAVYIQGKDKTKSISLHAAGSRNTFLLLAMLSPIAMLLFAVQIFLFHDQFPT